jgi:acetyl esterase/lipase
MDMSKDSDTRDAFASGYFLNKATIEWTLLHYCAPGTDLTDPRISPLLARDLAGLPPALVHTAEFDPLRSEGEAYADLLTRAGVDARHTCHAGMIHHFYGMAGVIPHARSAIAAIGAEIRRALEPIPPHATRTAVVPGRRGAASPEPMNTDRPELAWPVFMDSGLPRYARDPE